MKRAVRIVVGVAFVSATVSLRAGGADGPFHDQPASVQSLPADNLPPFGMLGRDGKLIMAPVIPAGALHRGSGSEPESSAPAPSLIQAIAAARGAIRACQRAGYRVGATVIDSAGEARAMLTADGSDGSHVFVAMRKALTALEFKMPSSRVSEIAATDQHVLDRVTAPMFVTGGALPIVVANQTIGAIGVSGAGGLPIGHQDEICAAAGLKLIATATP